jgi:cell division septation protein DedD
MPVRVVCPECGATTSLADESPKKTVDCRQCGKELPVPGAKSAGPPPLPARSGPPKLPTADPEFEVLEDEDVGEPVPVRSRVEEDEEEEDLADDTPRPGTVRDRDDVEDDESDDRSRRQAAARARLRGEDPDDDDEPPRHRSRVDDSEDDDEDEDEDDRPRRRVPAGQTSKAKLFLVLGLLAFLFVGGGGGAVAYYFWHKSAPDLAGNNPPLSDDDWVNFRDQSKTPAPKPVDPKPADPKPVEPKPVEPKPVEPKPVEPMPIEPKPKITKPIEPKPKITKPIEPKPIEPKPPAFAVGATLVNPAKTKQPIEPAVMSAAHVEIALPGPIKDVCVGGGGRFLILHIPTVRKLAIFDTSTLKLVRSITLGSDDVLFAAGMTKLMVVYPDEKLVTRWDLTTFKLEADVTLTAVAKPTSAAMGSATDGPLVLTGIPAQGVAAKLGLIFLDQTSMAEVRVDKIDGEFKVGFFSPSHLRVAADGNTIGGWYAQLQPTGLQIARLQGNAISGSYLPESVGHVTPTANGKLVGTEKGMFDVRALPSGERKCVVPAIQGIGNLELSGAVGSKQEVTVSLPGSTKSETFADLPGFDGKRDPFERDNPNLTLDKRLFLVPDAKVLVVIPPAAKMLHVYGVK